MIHVCSLARLPSTIDETGATHVVTILRHSDRVVLPEKIAHHLIINVDDITVPMDGYTAPAETHVEELVEFVSGWNRAAPMIVHCFAGISRSTAGAYVAACALNPQRDEAQIAWDIRNASPTAMPNALLVSHADKVLGRQGRMIRAIEAIGPAETAYEGTPFRLAIE